MGVKFSTTRFGELEVPDEKVITFPHGLIGLPEIHRFALIDSSAAAPFQWMQAVDAPEMAFVITDPKLFFKDYEVPVKKEELLSIGVDKIDEGVVVVILVVPHDPKRITANLMGPIVINMKNRLARQLVLDVPEYGTQHFIFPQEEAQESDTATQKEAAC